MKTPLRVVLYGEKAKAAKLLGWAKRLLVLDKKISMSGFVNRWLKTTSGDMIGLRSIRGFDTIIIKAIRRIFRGNSMEGSFPFWTMEACTAVDIWDRGGYVSGVRSATVPTQEMNPLPLDHGNCNEQEVEVFHAHGGGSVDSLSITLQSVTIDLLRGSNQHNNIVHRTGTIGPTDTIKVQAFVWDADGNVLATGTLLTLVGPTQIGGGPSFTGVDCPISYTFTKGDPIYYGVVYTEVTVGFLKGTTWLSQGVGVPSLKFNTSSGQWGTWTWSTGGKTIPPILQEVAYSDSFFDDNFYNVWWSNSFEPTPNQNVAFVEYGDKIGQVATAFAPQLFVMHVRNAVDFSRENLIIRFRTGPSQTVGALEGAGTIFVFKYTMAGVYVDSMFSVLPATLTPGVIEDTDIEFHFDTGEIKSAIWIDFTSSWSVSLLSNTFLVDGFKYTVALMKDTTNEQFSNPSSFKLGEDFISVLPRIQKVDFDSWFGQKINTNSAAKLTQDADELEGMQFPKWFGDRAILELGMDGEEGSIIFRNKIAPKSLVTVVGDAKVDTSTDPFSDGRGSLLLDGASRLVFDGEVDFKESNFEIGIFFKTSEPLGFFDLVVLPGSFSLVLGTNTINFLGFLESGQIAGLVKLVFLRDDNWHHVLIRRRADNWTMFLEGADSVTDTGPGPLKTPTGQLEIGRDFVGNLSNLIVDGYAKHTLDFNPLV